MISEQNALGLCREDGLLRIVLGYRYRPGSDRFILSSTQDQELTLPYPVIWADPRGRADGSDVEMPLARYFLFVGGVLLALLFIVDATLPKVTESVRTAVGPDKSIIRIHSDRKWPERLVFDTSLPTIVPASAAKADAVAPAPPIVAEASPKARVREAFAQFTPSEPKKPEPKPQRKRKIVKNRLVPPVVVVAQQPRFGFFESAW
jgi:hypothetical protein